MPLALQMARERGHRWLTEEMRLALRKGADALLTAGPRVIGPVSKEPPVIIFTDGACEADTSIGGVIFDPQRKCYEVEYFGAVVGTITVNSWKTRLDQDQVIGQAELFPVLVAKLTWAARLKGRRAI